jgi:hypothetical protein
MENDQAAKEVLIHERLCQCHQNLFGEEGSKVQVPEVVSVNPDVEKG